MEGIPAEVCVEVRTMGTKTDDRKIAFSTKIPLIQEQIKLGNKTNQLTQKMIRSTIWPGVENLTRK